MGELKSRIDESANYLRDLAGEAPQIGLILGSGLGELADELREPVAAGYDEIPGFRESTVEGHEGRLVFGELEGKSVCIMQGRYHYYEGYTVQDLVFPVRAMWGLGIEHLIVTNASGGVNEHYDVGDLVVLEDHINLIGDNPLIGENDDAVGPRFTDMTYAYDPDLRQLAHDCADRVGLSLREGVYAANSGPSYETPAEIDMLRTVGADLVGMSTVPEVIAANHCGMDVLGLSCVTNMAAGVLDESLDHEEVIETTERVKEDFKAVVRRVVLSLDV